ncbi:MAG TPA: BadF/BadG/BcrA/BcrD ATPase family protein [Pyrinomonadaceae bacterium]|nr:BadF/BadG/BcrA/BcrD ATPase family protein [Pyrinomonadaceae bacterium]
MYLGVDGGGTKTQVVLLNDENHFVSEGFAGASNPLRVGVETAVSNIVKAAEAACDAADRSRGDIVSAALGLAGVRREDLRRRIRESFFSRMRIKNIEVTTDAEIALYGVTLGKAGLVVIAGTGSVCMGRNAGGEIETAGGWGPLAGDEGGGAGIARRALQAIAKASDGRGKPTDLSDMAIEYFRAGKLEDLAVAIYAPTIDNARIAGFARFVVEVAEAGDETAVEILREAGRELGMAAEAVIKKLKLKSHKFPVGCVGGIFKAGELITASLLETIRRTAPKAILSAPKLVPAHAAALLAFENFKK